MIEEPNIEEEDTNLVEQQELIIEHIPPMLDTNGFTSANGFGGGLNNLTSQTSSNNSSHISSHATASLNTPQHAEDDQDHDSSLLPPPMNVIRPEQVRKFFLLNFLTTV